MYGEPSRLSSDRGRSNGTPVSVDQLYAADTPGAFQPADDRVERWIAAGTMIRHRDAVLVRYVIERPNQTPLVGLVGVMNLAETTILPHEPTTPSEVAARMADIERAGALLEPIMVMAAPGFGPMFDDGSLLRVVTYGDETHSIYALKPEDVQWPGESHDRKFVIADGHHRVQAILQHADNSGNAPLGLMIAVDTRTQGMTVEPQHRVLAGLIPKRPATSDHFDVLPFSLADGVPRGAVGIITKFDAWLMSPTFDAGISAAVLTEYVAPLLGLAVSGVATRERDAVAEMAKGAAAAAIMGPITTDVVITEARGGRLLPHKATCFSPKVAVGLVGALLGGYAS